MMIMFQIMIGYICCCFWCVSDDGILMSCFCSRFFAVGFLISEWLFLMEDMHYMLMEGFRFSVP